MPDIRHLRSLRLTREQMFAGGGCHGKLAGVRLEEVLSCAWNADSGGEMPAFLSRPEDSALIELSGESLLCSTDLIYLSGANLYDAGRIGVLHALNDIYASGGLPRWALVTLLISRKMPFEYGQAVMAGVRDACAQEGVAIVGGHTVTGNEAMVGLSVIGSAAQRPLRKSGAAPGDRLFLSKPVGTGLSLAGFKNGLCGEETLAEAIDVMLVSGKAAAEAALRANATACTDVSGFGLLGHLAELLSSGLGVELKKDAVPTLEFAGTAPRVLAESASIRNNYEYAASRVEMRCSEAVHQLAALLDPQTNGPLLVAAPAGSAASLLSAGYTEIGQFTELPLLVVQ